MSSTRLDPTGVAAAAGDWRRLSPRMLLVHPVRELGRAIPYLAGLFIAGHSAGNGQWWWGPLGVVAVITLSILRWFTTAYRITPEQIQLKTGLLRRRTVAAPADRVRSVEVTASALHRLLGLAKVEIGTGTSDKDSGLKLDALGAGQARRLRAELLHRGVALPPPSGPPADPDAVPAGIPLAPPAPRERELARLDPRWVRLAPFTLSGLLTVAAVAGLGQRVFDQGNIDATRWGPVRRGLNHLEGTPIWLDALQGLVGLAVIVSLLSIIGYVLSYWGFRLSRHEGGTLHVTRGLLTTRATSIEERRLRGVELHEPLLLRLAGGARLSGITTGLRARRGSEGSRSMLLPPAPAQVAARVGAEVLLDPAPFAVPLTPHGPAARRRRYPRALFLPLVLLAAALAATSWGLPRWVVAVALLPLAAALPLAQDRYRSLGHALTGVFLVSRSGSLVRRRAVLAREGIIGWNLRQTFFQRRAGLATLTATTAAGQQDYEVLDLPLAEALALADDAVPDLLTDFLG